MDEPARGIVDCESAGLAGRNLKSQPDRVSRRVAENRQQSAELPGRFFLDPGEFVAVDVQPVQVRLEHTVVRHVPRHAALVDRIKPRHDVVIAAVNDGAVPQVKLVVPVVHQGRVLKVGRDGSDDRVLAAIEGQHGRHVPAAQVELVESLIQYQRVDIPGQLRDSGHRVG